MRLVDDAGVAYPYVPADDNEGDIRLAPGQSVSGGFAFRGPLDGRPDRLYLADGVENEEIADFDMNEAAGTHYPKFVVPFDLAWG